MSVKSLVCIAVLLTSALGLAGPAAGQTSDDAVGAMSCVFDDVTGQTATGQNGVNSVFNDLWDGGAWDPAPLQLMDSDPGDFDLGGTAICAGVDLADEAGQATTPEPFGPTAVEIEGTGIYRNLVCGTGTVSGSAVIVEVPSSVPDIQINASFGVTFVGGHGQLSITLGPPSWIGNDNVDNGNGLGAMSIVPNSTFESSGNLPTGVPCVGGTSEPPGPGAIGTDDDESNLTRFGIKGGFETSFGGEGTNSANAGDDSDM